MGSNFYRDSFDGGPRQIDIRIGERVTELVPRTNLSKRKRPISFFVGFSMLGQLGLVIAIPIVLGVLGGYWIDQHIVHNRLATIGGLGIGIVISLVNAYATIQTIRSFSRN